MSHDAALRKELNQLSAVATVESLWSRSDLSWQDKPALESHVRTLEKLLDLNGKHREACQKGLDAIQHAIEAVPAGLSLDTPDSKAAFIAQVWAALAVRQVPLREHVANVEATVYARLELYRAVLLAANALDSAQTGLQFKDAARQAALEQQYAAFEQHLRSERETFITRAEQDMVAVARALPTIDKRTQRADYELLNNNRKCLRDELEALARNLTAQAKQAAKAAGAIQEQLNRATPEQKGKLDAQFALLRKRADELSAEAEATQSRVEEIALRAGLGARR